MHDENAGVELECAGPVLGFSLAHNLPGIGPPPSLMMGASSSGGYEPFKSGRCDHEPQSYPVPPAAMGYEPCFGGQYYSHNGGCDV